MVNIGSTATGAKVVAVKHDAAKLQLTSPACTEIGEKVAMSRRIEKHWRLIGWYVFQWVFLTRRSTVILTAKTGLPSRPVPPPSRNPLKRVASLMHELFFSTAKANDETCLTMAGVFRGSVGVLHSVVLHRRSTAGNEKCYSMILVFVIAFHPLLGAEYSSRTCSQYTLFSTSSYNPLPWTFFRRSDSLVGLEHDDVGYIRSDPGK